MAIPGIKCVTRPCLRILPFSAQSSISTVPLLAIREKRRSHPRQSQRPVPGREPRYLPRPPNQNQLRVKMRTVQRGLGAGPGSIQRIRLLLRWVEALLFCHTVLLPDRSFRFVLLSSSRFCSRLPRPSNPHSAHSYSTLPPPSPVIIHPKLFHDKQSALQLIRKDSTRTTDFPSVAPTNTNTLSTASL